MTDAEATSEEQLDSLLREGRISPEDYDTLQQAMSKGGVEVAHRRREATQRRLTKKWSGRQLGGVCAGLGEFFGLDPWSVRAAFVLALMLTGGTATVVYLVLYFTLPWSGRDKVSLATDKKRRGGTRAFLASLIALWLFGMFFNLYLVPSLLAVAQHMGRPVPGPFRLLAPVSGVWMSYFSLGLQVLCLGLAYLAFRLAPTGGAVRRGIPRALILGVSLYFLSWLWALLSLSYG